MFVTGSALPVTDLARACEERGLESLWVPEHPVVPACHATRYPLSDDGKLPRPHTGLPAAFATLAAAAGVTRRLRLGTGVCLVPERDPLLTAHQVATLDWLSNGRFLFGIGAGWLREEMDLFTPHFPYRFAFMREAVAAMRKLWTGEEVSFEGRWVRFPPAICRPRPVQQPHPPVISGCGGPLAPASRAARRGRHLLHDAGGLGGCVLVREADRRGELPSDDLRHEERDVDVRVGKAARDRGPEPRAIVALDEQARDVDGLGEASLLRRARHLLSAHRVELDGGALRGVRKTVAHDEAQIGARACQRLERAREHARLVLDVGAPQGDALHGDRHADLLGGELPGKLAQVAPAPKGAGGRERPSGQCAAGALRPPQLCRAERTAIGSRCRAYVAIHPGTGVAHAG